MRLGLTRGGRRSHHQSASAPSATTIAMAMSRAGPTGPPARLGPGVSVKVPLPASDRISATSDAVPSPLAGSVACAEPSASCSEPGTVVLAP